MNDDSNNNVVDEEGVVPAGEFSPQLETEVLPEVTAEPTPEEIEKMLQEIKRHNIKASSKIFKGGIKFGGSSKVGITRKVKKVSKKVGRKSKDSRAKNRKIANKKFRPTGSKKGK